MHPALSRILRLHSANDLRVLPHLCLSLLQSHSNGARFLCLRLKALLTLRAKLFQDLPRRGDDALASSKAGKAVQTDWSRIEPVLRQGQRFPAASATDSAAPRVLQLLPVRGQSAPRCLTRSAN